MSRQRIGRTCTTAGCPAIVTDGRSRCPVHRRERERERGSARARGYDRNWEEISGIILRRDPICVACGMAPSQHADHITPLRRGGTNEPENLQGLCAPCHSRKTAREDGGFGR
jgi:5-methylcytosine-specific restriction enzyme A